MYIKIFIIVESLFCSGGLAIFIICLKKPKEARQKQWLKFWSYVVIVHTIILTLQVKWAFTSICVLIAITGLIELLKVAAQNKLYIKKLIIILFTYGIISYFFICFSITSSPERILFVYLVVAAFDAFSQITGQLFGHHKLAPSISPAKTIEGALGGFSFAIILSFLLHASLNPSVFHPAIIGAIIATSSLAGDLTSSWYKRLHNVKDFSNWLPGQGGIIDRFNSFIGSAVSVYLISRL
jgi:phosphatidate cytidylyltransferase